MKTCRFDWDEPPGASSPRGWLGLLNHPDIAKHGKDYVMRCVGNYLTYTQAHGPNGERIHAMAYIARYSWDGRRENISLGYAWFHTIADAKRFIEGNVRAYFGLARDAA